MSALQGIAPTLIIVRISLGKSIDTTMHGTITSIRFANPTITLPDDEKHYQDSGASSADSSTNVNINAV